MTKTIRLTRSFSINAWLVKKFNYYIGKFGLMVLSEREKVVALVANGIAAFSIYREEGKIEENSTLFDFVLKVVPARYHSSLTPELIDNVFEFVSNAHNS